MEFWRIVWSGQIGRTCADRVGTISSGAGAGLLRERRA